MFSDFSIECTEKSFNVHKLVLADKSEYFKKLLMDEPERTSLSVECSSEVLEDAVNHIYGRKVDNLKDHAPQLLILAKKVFQVIPMENYQLMIYSPPVCPPRSPDRML